MARLSPPSPTIAFALGHSLIKGGFGAPEQLLHLTSEDDEWAEPTSGGLCLDSLPLHIVVEASLQALH